MHAIYQHTAIVFSNLSFDFRLGAMGLNSASDRTYIRLLFAYNQSMFPTPSGRKGFVVTCKRCRRDVPAGREEFPFHSIAVACPLCGELRQYRPSEVYLGRPDQLVVRQRRAASK